MTKLIFILVMAFSIPISTSSATAQQAGKVYRIGVLGTASERVQGVFIESLRGGLRDAGYVEGRNIVLDVHFGNAKRRRIAERAAELVRRKVDVIVGLGMGAIRAAAKKTDTIPIISGFSSDLPGSGLVASLAKPGGNVTGMATLASDLGTKWLQLIKETLPTASRVAVLFNPTQPSAQSSVKFIRSAAGSVGVTIQEVHVRAPGDFEKAFAAMTKARADALIMIPGRVTGGNRLRLIKLASKTKIPNMCWRQGLARLGCFMSYGANRSHMVRRSASYVVRILRGAKAADLPVERATKYDFVINLNTAKSLGIKVPPSILFRATEVIE